MARDISESLGKLPPQAPDLEEAVLGAAMLEKGAYRILIQLGNPDDFYVEAHKIIFEAIRALADNGDPVDMRTVVAQLRKQGQLELVEGAYKIAELTSKVSSAANMEWHLRKVQEMRFKRDMIEIASEVHSMAYEDTTDVFELQDWLNSKVNELNKQVLRGGKTALAIKDGLFNLVKNIQARDQIAEGETVITGVRSGYARLDNLTQGWQPSDLIIIAGRPGMAKTTLALNLGRNASADWGVPTAFFSLEMSAEQLVMKLAASDSQIDFRQIRTGRFSEVQWQQFTHMTGKLASAPLWIDDTAGLSISDLQNKARQLKHDHNIGLIIIDYMQLMRGEQGRGMNREQEISSISRGLKLIAKELNIPVIALSQLSRAVEEAPRKKPMLNHLRESGSIEQDADAVVFIWRPEYYGYKEDEDGQLYAPGFTELKWAKHRNGGLGEIILRFVGQTSKFTELTTSDQYVPKAPVGANIPFEIVRNTERMIGDAPVESKADDDMPF